MTKELITFEEIEQKIYLIRGKKVMIDSDLAELYGVKTKVLNQAVAGNKDRFPENFMFSLNISEQRNLRSQIVTSSLEHGTESEEWGGRRYSPKVFTEHGILMLANVLKNKFAVKVSIQIVEAFIQLRTQLAELNKVNFRLDAVEKRLAEHDEAFELFNKVILPLLEAPEPAKRKIGFQSDKDDEE